MASPLADVVRFPGACEGPRAGIDSCCAGGIQKASPLPRTPRTLARPALDAAPRGSGGGPRSRSVPRSTPSTWLGVQRERSFAAMAAFAEEHVQGTQRRPGPACGPSCGPLGLGIARGAAPQLRVDHRSWGGWETSKSGVGERGGPRVGLFVRCSAAPCVGALGQVGGAGAQRRVGPARWQPGRGCVSAVPSPESVVGVPRLLEAARSAK